MKLLLIPILSTALLAGCAGFWDSYEFGDITEIAVELNEINEIERQSRCNMDVTQCKKYGLEQVKKNKCRYRGETDCYTVFSRENK